MKTYNHLFLLGIAVTGSHDPSGQNVSVSEYKSALRQRIRELGDNQLLWDDALQGPADSYEEPAAPAQSKEGAYFELKDELAVGADGLREVVMERMPSKGNVASECQRQHILNLLMEVQQAINSIELSDLEPNEDDT